MVRKKTLEEKINIAWYVHTGRRDGWDVFTANYGNVTQQKMADMFGVRLNASQVWHKEYREMHKMEVR